MQRDSFVKKFCEADEETAFSNLYNLTTELNALIKALTYPFLNKAEDAARTLSDITQEVIINFWKNRTNICQNNLSTDKAFKDYFLKAIKHKCIDADRQNKAKLNATISQKQLQKEKWNKVLSKQEKELLKNEGDLSVLEIAILVISELHQISDLLKLLVVLNIKAKLDVKLYKQLKSKSFIIDTNELNNNWENLNILEVYAMKSKDVVSLLPGLKHKIDDLRNDLRKYKQYIKRKLNRKGL